MKRLALVICCAAATVAFADTQPSQPQKKAAPPASAAAVPSTAGMQEHMKDMQALMTKIENTQDRAERQRLLEQHQEAMRAQMDRMQHMGMGAGMGQGMAQCQENMQARMSMMSAMVEQMMRHEEAEHPAHH
jgi:hypothetical protein